ncbi:hypothetical protein GLOIN_2v1481191 [Rhizophagus irregularis DAOM 181602=DAOM 197198]|nr:hypothetical protein GLOIN_2v1481191 [Rhizophagus irregularis DAOM 181602=DAOM 197198]
MAFTSDKCFYYDNFTNINLSLYSEPFNINFLPSSLELSEPPSISPVLPFVLSVKPLLTSDNNFTDIEPSLPLEPSFDSNDSTINRRKSFHCSLSSNYEPQKILDQKLHWLHGTIKTNCEWHVNFTFPKSAHQIGCTTLKDVHNHEVNPAQISHIIARYRRLNSEMIQDLKFFSDCKVAPITQLEILKKKYPEHVFHKQDVYNAIYKLRQSNRDEKLDSVLFLNVLLEKMTQDPPNALVEDGMASTYTWILQCLMKATDNIAPKAFWTDSEINLKSKLGLRFNVFRHYMNLQAETIDDNFIEVVDEPQITLKAILDCIDTSNIIENLLQKELFAITFDDILDNSPVLIALESSTEVNTTSRTVDFTLQSLRQLQGSCHKENAQRIIPQRSCPQVGGRFGRFGKKNKVFSK